ncbi:MobV family relaxase [Ornithobacterium rhinotracheale]|uniref:MobV family relaxase n=1 Tax=Ornithobacterium rhinotracheale TaxID=28251 RepID=UPI003FA49D89
MAYAGFAVYHVEKGTISSGGIGKHIDREKGSEHTYRHADPSRRHLNKNYKVYGDRHKMKLSDAINERIKEGYKNKAKIRKNAVKYVTHILTGSHEDMKKMEENGTLNDWVKENYEFLSQEYGFQNIVRFTLHMDEKTPHLHAVTIPLTKDGRLSAFEIIGNRKKMQERQDRYAERMEQFGLRRGVKSTGITHEGAKEYYTRMSLANEVAQEKTEDSIPMETQIKALKALNRKLKIENQKAYLPKRMRERVAHVGKYIKERDEILAEKKAIEQKISSYENEIKGLEKKVKEEEKRTETYISLYSQRSNKISQYDSQINELKAEKEKLLREKEEAESRMQEEMQKHKSSNETLQTKIDFLKDKRAEMMSEFSKLTEEKKALEEKLALKTNDDEKNRLKNELAQAYFKLERYQTMPIYARFEETRGMMKTSGKVSGRFLFLYMWDYSQKELAEELLTYGFSRDIAEKIAYTPLSDFVEKNSYGHIEPKPYLERLGEEIKQNEALMKFLKDKFKGMKQMQNNQEQTRRGIRR